MPSESPRPGSLQRLERYNDGGELSPWLQSSKVKLFAVSFSVVLVLGLVWTVLQPLVYRSSATVLMSAPTAIDAGVSEANIQNVAIQRTILLGQEITHRVLGELADAQQFSMSADELSDALHVIPVPDTNLIEMIAQGADGDVLPTLVNTWIEVYMAVRAEDIALRKDRTVRIVQEELAGLAIKIEQTRDNLALYRRQNDIISAKREENEVLARLDGLNKALNTAVEEEVKTRVYLETLQESIQQGQAIIPNSDLRSLRSLESELETLRVEMLVISKRYTKEYIDKHPSMRAIPERIAELEKDLAMRLSEAQALELATARQAYSAARRALQALQEKLDEHKQKVSEFSRIYATHEALVEDLRGLEELNRETQARLVQVEVRQVDKYPQFSVIERPASAERTGPDYLLLLGATLASALGCGVLSVWLYGFLGHDRATPAYVTLQGVHMYPQDAEGQLGYARKPDARLDSAGTPRLRTGGSENIPDKNDE
jgi:succinoglycan biosynthesis transport protein ExoP